MENVFRIVADIFGRCFFVVCCVLFQNGKLLNTGNGTITGSGETLKNFYIHQSFIQELLNGANWGSMVGDLYVSDDRIKTILGEDTNTTYADYVSRYLLSIIAGLDDGSLKTELGLLVDNSADGILNAKVWVFMVYHGCDVYNSIAEKCRGNASGDNARSLSYMAGYFDSRHEAYSRYKKHVDAILFSSMDFNKKIGLIISHMQGCYLTEDDTSKQKMLEFIQTLEYRQFVKGQGDDILSGYDAVRCLN